MNFKIVNLSNILPVPDTCSILDPIPWFVEYVTSSRFLTVELSWRTHLSLHQRVDYASRHDGEDSKSFDLQLATSPPVFYKIFYRLFVAFHFWLFLSADRIFDSWVVEPLPSFHMVCEIFVFSWNVWQVVNLWHSKFRTNVQLFTENQS